MSMLPVYYSPRTREKYQEVRRTRLHVWYARWANGQRYVGFVPLKDWERYYASLPLASD